MTRMVEFVVTGRGVFPFDMLRYDHCWPRTEQDAAMIERMTRAREASKPSVVCLKDLVKPTEARWESFGWKVSTVTTAGSGRWEA